MSFRVKIMAIIMAVLVSALLLLAFSTSKITSHRVKLHSAESAGTPHVPEVDAALKLALENGYQTGGWFGLRRAFAEAKPDGSYMVFDTTGRVQASTRHSFLGAKIDDAGLLLADEGRLRLLLDIKGALQLIAADGAIGSIVFMPDMGLGSEEPGDLAGLISKDIWIAAVAVGALALLLSWFAVQKALAPVNAASEAIDKLRDGDDTLLVPVEGRDEIARIAESLNLLLGEQRHSQKVRQSLLADLAHELRTPLTGLRCQAETLVDGLKQASPENLRSLLDGVLHLQALYADLEALALADADKLPLTLTTQDLTPLLGECVRTAQMLDGAQVIELADTGADLKVHADPKRLQQVVLNILSNAVRYSNGGKPITVLVTHEEALAFIDIIDSGPGISLEHADAVFTRFFRSDPARDPNAGGHGLGLSIARHTARAMGGDVKLMNPGAAGAHFRIIVQIAKK